MDLPLFFQEAEQFSTLEKIALASCGAQVLDIGCGAGRHALYLQKMGKQVVGLEAEPLSAEIARELGVQNVEVSTWQGKTALPVFDTTLALWNGVGLCGTYANLGPYLDWCFCNLRPGGWAIFDSTTVEYLPMPSDKTRRPDEVWFRFVYKEKAGEWFSWLFAKYLTVKAAMEKTGFEQIECMYENKAGQFLIRGYRPW
jgi:SAM-dependent methyltransferase